MKILLINSCIRAESRTLYLAKRLATLFEGEIKEVKTIDCKPITLEALYERDNIKLNKDFNNDALKLARDFRDADIIIIAAPFYDFSFPASLKAYIENISVGGVTFTYKDDKPFGLCKAKRLYYVSTSGGKYVSEYGFGYIKAVSSALFGITSFKEFYAEMLDVLGANVDKILNEAIKEIEKEKEYANSFN